MAEIAVLGLRVDASGAIVATENLGRSLNTLGDRGEKATNALSDGFKKLAAAVSAALVIQKFVQETTTAQNAQAQLESAVRSTGGAAGRSVEQLNNMSASLQKITTFADDTVTSAQSLLLTFDKIKGDTFDQATKAAANLATRLGGDLNGAALQVGKALQDPERGVNALRRAGVSFSESQLTLIKRLQETGQLAQAQQIVLAELEKQFGGAANAARNTFGGAIEALKNNFGDLFEITKEGGGGITDFVNRLATLASVLNNNRDLIADVGKAALIAAGAFFIWSKQAQIVAFYNAIVAGTSAISGFIALARAIGLAAAAMDLFGKVGILRLVSIAAGIVGLVLGFLGVKKVLGEFSSEYDKLQKDLKANPLNTGLIAQTGEGSIGPSQEELDNIKEAKQSQLERVVIARQQLELVGKIGAEEALQVVRNKAINDSIAATGKLKGDALRITQATIKEELKLAEQTVLAQRAAKLNAENRERLILAQQAFEQVGLEGEALAKLIVEQTRLNKLREAEATLTGSELDARKRVIENEAQLATAAVVTNGILERRVEKQKLLAEKAKKILDEQKQQAENFERQFLSTVSSGIEGLLKSGTDGFKSFTESVKNLFLKLFADLLAANVFKRLTTALGAFIPGASLDPKNVANANFGAGGASTFAGGASVALGAAAVGYGVGSRFTDKRVGFASGAATGALLGTVVPGVGNAVGAVIGGIVGGIAGLLGSANAAKKSAEAAAAAQKKFNLTLDQLRTSIESGAGLETAIKKTKVEFQALREQALVDFAGKKGEPGRAVALAEINRLEAVRIDQIRAEFTETQRRLQADLKVRELRAKGLDQEADKIAIAEAQSREYAAAVKEGADAATLAQLAQTQLAEAQKALADSAKVAAAKIEDNRRTLFNLANDTKAFTDPRGAQRDADIEDANNRIFDAIQRGASEAELAALALYNTALLARKQADLLESDRRTTESLITRSRTAAGDTRGAEDSSLRASQRQELADAIKDGFSPTNLALLQFTQFSEREAVLTRRAIEDGTKSINKAAELANKDIDVLIDATRTASRNEIAAINKQISEITAAGAISQKGFDNQIAKEKENAKAATEAIDAQIAATQFSNDIQKAQLSALEKNVAASEKVVETLTKFTDSLKLGDLSTLSPEAKLAEARAQFEALATRARGGDADAATALPAAATALLQASKSFNATNPAFAADFDRVNAVISAITAQFGETLPIDKQQLEVLQKAVKAGESTVEALNRQKEAIQKQSELNVAKLEEQKQKDAENTAKLLEALEKQRETVESREEATITKLEELKKANLEAAERQIEQLIADENAKLQTRIRENEFYDLFKLYSESSTAYFDIARNALENPLGGGTSDGLGGTTGTGGSAGTPNAPANPVQIALEATVAELKNINRELTERLGTVEAQLERLIDTEVAASEDEVRAIERGTSATLSVAAEVRAGAQLNSVRRPPIGIGSRT